LKVSTFAALTKIFMKHYLIGVIAAMMITGTAIAQHYNFGIKGNAVGIFG
jgi:hypothetical protein